jgi:cytochrome b561
MDTVRDRLTGRLHVAVALLAAWLIVTSPWVAMYRHVPANPGFLNGSHVVLGFASLALAALYLLACARRGRWRLYFPWLAGQGGAALCDLKELARGTIPSAEGGGLFAIIEGLTLLSLFVTAITGVAWFVGHGSDGALIWRDYHVDSARILIGMLIAHVFTVSLHLLEFVRN